MSGLIVSLLAIAFITFFIILIYNKLILLKNRVKNSFAQIDVQLKRRYDLIPNLVETAKEYMRHESATLDKITRARAGAMQAGQKASSNPNDAATMKVLVDAEQSLANALSGFKLSVEAYPNLKADKNMMLLFEELTSTENKISFARQAYNDAVTTYNTSCQKFPNVLLAGPFGFKETVLFELTEPEERKAVTVQF